MNEIIKSLLKALVKRLVDSNYGEIIARNENGRLTEAEIRKAIKDYPGVLSLPPDSAYDATYIYDIYDERKQARQIEFDLWYDGKPSDLTLSAEVCLVSKSKFGIFLSDIHVL